MTRPLERLNTMLPALLRESRGASLVLGTVVRGRRSVICHGALDREGRPPADARTLFELGAVTKTFTGLLLAEMVERGEVGLDEPIRTYLPTEVRVPRRTGQITLGQLASHTSGLPAVPRNLSRSRARTPNPFERYELAELYAGLSRTTPHGRPGTAGPDSALGVGLLGILLGAVAGQDWQRLVVERVCLPLGLTQTCADERERPELLSAIGHRRGRKVPPWRMGALAAAGALRSTPCDLLRYLDAHLRPERTPLERALWRSHEPRGRTRSGDQRCLDWLRRIDPAGETVYLHAGGTTGALSFLALCPRRGTGLMLAADVNPGGRARVVDLAYRLFTEITADEAVRHREAELRVWASAAPYSGPFEMPALSGVLLPEA
ncbi:serine hydrolase domain-containing protein [Actinoalloteichus hymeniacidonis]|uniref:Penicillin-binding protein, beta-lactamase class C n=1 Tax=Actinoalloteichus hymeniacidonis TaxID=340345 RepID=A0AAC9MXT6_9PSEU|nr:serine hydrolase domain-containing protein [Actinoalloteichus hymeniacidonis]AOS63658.1 penicillin-binding protein, beta-lactamase class C [Actinoalloteichus hymeniacidonis]MBB5908294.1 CubicO group peptidase (beta-lactamase class C family) [Actinoalloteichus hymeniacidonis]